MDSCIIPVGGDYRFCIDVRGWASSTYYYQTGTLAYFCENTERFDCNFLSTSITIEDDRCVAVETFGVFTKMV